MLGEERWRDRCDRYFSSINDIRKESDAAAAAAEASPVEYKPKDKTSKRNKPRTVDLTEDPPPNGANAIFTTRAAAAERTTKKTTKRTTMKKTTEDRVVIRANGRAYRTKHRPFKGPRRWLSSLDLHGTSMLQRTESATYFFLWLVIVAGGCSALGYLAYLVVDNYLDGSTHFKATVGPEGAALELPLAISVCNLNPLRKNHVFTNSRFAGLLRLNSSVPPSFQQVRPTDIELLLQRTQFRRFLDRPYYSNLNLLNLLNELQDEYPVYGAMTTEQDWENLYAASLRASHYDTFPAALRVTAIEMSSLGHHMQASMLQCIKNGHDCDLTDVNYPRVLDYGNCATVNLSVDSSTWFESLSLIYDVEPEEYLEFVTSSRAMRVFLHAPQDGFWRATEFIAPVGYALKLKIVKVTETERLSSNCDGSNGYNYDQCLQSCMEEEIRTVCGCARSIGATLNQKCRPNVQYEYLCFRTIEELARTELLQCGCPRNCLDKKFDVQVSQVPWPASNFENHLRRSFVEKGIIKSFPSIREKLAKIEVSLGHIERLQLKEEEDTTWLQLLIQLGALSALTAGISVVTGVEIVWVIGRLFFQCMRAAWRGRHEDNQVKALTTHSLPEFDDLGFNWYSLQGHDADHNLAGMVVAGRNTAAGDAELTPPGLQAPNLLGLDPIVEESDVDVRAVDGAEEDKLYTHAWERSGHSRPYKRVLVSGKEANISDAPLLNAPGNLTSLRSELYRADSPPSASQIGNAPRALLSSGAEAGKVGGRDSGNYILKSRTPYTWHPAHFGGAASRQSRMTPADFITVYGQSARQLYEDDNSPSFYMP